MNINDDLVREDQETFTVNIIDTTVLAVPGNPSSASVNIDDNDIGKLNGRLHMYNYYL